MAGEHPRFAEYLAQEPVARALEPSLLEAVVQSDEAIKKMDEEQLQALFAVCLAEFVERKILPAEAVEQIGLIVVAVWFLGFGLVGEGGQ